MLVHLQYYINPGPSDFGGSVVRWLVSCFTSSPGLGCDNMTVVLVRFEDWGLTGLEALRAR